MVIYRVDYEQKKKGIYLEKNTNMGTVSNQKGKPS